MASTNQIKLDYVSCKLEFLEKLQSHINAAVADYINEVVSASKAWMESPGDQATFLDISQKVDNAVDFLSLKCREISDKITEKQAEMQKQDNLEEEDCSRENMNEELERKIKEIGDNTKLVKCKINALQASFEETDSSVKDLLNRVVSQEQVTQSLCTKVDTNMEKLKTISTSQERNDVKLSEIEGRLQVKKELQKVGEHFGETEISFKNVCQLMMNRLRPLEDLGRILYLRDKAQDGTFSQLEEMVKQLANACQEMTQLQTQLTTPGIGFVAWKNIKEPSGAKSVLKSYNDFLCISSGHFNLSTGIFTAPVDGTYVAFIEVKLKNHTNHALCEIRCKKGTFHTHHAEYCHVGYMCARTFNFCLVQLEAGDNLYVFTLNELLGSAVGFSCFMTG